MVSGIICIFAHRLEGRAEGKSEANRENAHKMKELGIAAEVISQVTGLTTEEIQDLWFVR